LQATGQLADEEARDVRFDEVPVDKVSGLSINPYSDQGIVGRINTSRIMALTLMRRLCPSGHKGDPRLLLLNPSLTYNESVHGAIEGEEVAERSMSAH
jgi:hypothetical protein